MTDVVAFDPGTLTGTVLYRVGEGLIYAEQLTVTELYDWVDANCGEFSHAQIERFTISARTIRAARVDDPLDVIGYLKYASYRCGFPYNLSKPADVMGPFPDAALKRAGLFTKGKPHANDAARHLARRLVIDRQIDPKRFLP